MQKFNKMDPSKKYLITIVSNCGRGYIETIIPKIEISNYITDYIVIMR